MTQIDWTRFNWPEIFGTMDALKSLEGEQYKFMKSDIQERCAEQWSDSQLRYVGNTQIGKDYIGIDGFRYESKVVQGLIQKRVPHTKPIILKNYRGNSTGIPEQTFDFMIAYDSTKNTVLLAPWDVCMKMMNMKDASLNINLLVGQCEIIAKDVEPIKKKWCLKEKYNTMLNECM